VPFVNESIYAATIVVSRKKGKIKVFEKLASGGGIE
jgi:hypothetical protein